MLLRPATHAGTWYDALGRRLRAQFDGWWSQEPVAGARVLVGPHAGYAYCGERLAETYGSWDPAGCARVFILGPLHHVYFRNVARVAYYSGYETPMGVVRVDGEVVAALTAQGGFERMLAKADRDEHLFEMHLPALVYACERAGVEVPPVVPIMLGSGGERFEAQVAEALEGYMADPSNTFVVLSDFCHWGARFGYTAGVTAGFAEVAVGGALGEEVTEEAGGPTPIHEQIAQLDRKAMAVASGGSYEAWRWYIGETGNTICGERPLAVVLKGFGGRAKWQWVGYSQSGAVEEQSDLSVSYASGYAVA